jgi:hypothetical protein
VVGISYLVRGIRRPRTLVGLKSDTPSILVGASRSFKAPTVAEIKAFRLDSERRATLLKFCPLAAFAVRKGMVDVTVF